MKSQAAALCWIEAWQLLRAMILDRLRQAVFPPVCLVCGQTGRPLIDCCAGCESDLPSLPGQCDRCGLELNRSVALCGRCSMALPAFDSTWPGFAYRDEIERLVQRFKFRGDLAAGRLLANLLALRLSKLRAPRPDLLIPVPLHRRRLLTRGFNQAALLAHDLSAVMSGLPWFNALRRVRNTATQIQLPADGRAANVRGAFRVARLPGRPRFVALVDDVMTTGSTLNECARVLRASGVERIDVWVAARA